MSSLLDPALQRRLEALALVARRRYAGRLRAERRSATVGAGVLFADHRPYVPGDDFRAIDFGVFERSRKLHVRLFEQEEDLSVHLLVDTSASMRFGRPSKLETAKRLAASIGYVALARLDRVSVVAFGDKTEERLAPIRGKNRALRMLAFLEGLEAAGRTDFETALKTFSIEHERRGIVVVLSDFYDAAGADRGLDRLRFGRFEPHVVHIVDEKEREPLAQGDLRLVDAETRRTLDVTMTPALVDAHRRRLEAHRERLAEYCREKRLPYHEVSVSAPVEDVVLRVLRRGGLVG